MDFNCEEFKPDNDESLKFFYNREARLKKAPQNVQDYYNGNFELQKGFKVLFKNKTNKFLLLTLCVLTAFVFFFSRINTGKNKGSLDNLKLELTAFSYEDEIFSSVKISEIKKNENSERNPIVVNLSFDFINTYGQIFDQKEFSLLMDNTEKTQSCKITDFDITEITLTAYTEKDSIMLRTPVKK